MTPRLRSVLLNLALVAASVLIVCLAAEGALRILGFEARTRVRVVPGKGITFEPGAFYRHTKEGFSEGRFNAHGFRDRERSIAKPPGTRRILVLGDSFTEALQVDRDDAFPAVLERLLKDAPGGPYEVLAMGQSGFSTADEYMRWRNFGAAYDPDVVLLEFFAGNDVRDNSKDLNRAAVGYYFDLDGAGRLVLDDSVMRAYERARACEPRLVDVLMDRSRLVGLVADRLTLLRRARRRARAARAAAAADSLDPRSDLNVFLEGAGPRWDHAWAITRALLARFRDDVRAHGARFAVVSVGTAEQVDPAYGEAVRRERGLPLDFDRPDRLLGAALADLDVPFLALASPMRARQEETGLPMHGFGGRPGGHWNADGHRVAAELIDPFLLDDVLGESVPRS